MNIIKAAESVIKSRMDEYAFEINCCIQRQSDKDSLDRLLKCLSSYERSASQFEVLQKVKEQISTSPPEEVSDQNEN
ncbi:MAG: hypothetical protein ABF261_09185 [Candidatus Arcticimaribacter sp.]